VRGECDFFLLLFLKKNDNKKMKAFIEFFGHIITVSVDDLIPLNKTVKNPDFALYKSSSPPIIVKIYHIRTKRYVKKVFAYDDVRDLYIHNKNFCIGKTINTSHLTVYKTKKAARSAALKLSGWWTRYNHDGSFKEKLYFNPNDTNIVDISGYTKRIAPLKYNNFLVKHDLVRNLTTIQTHKRELVKKYTGIVLYFYSNSINILIVENYKNLRFNGATKYLSKDGRTQEVTYYKNGKICGMMFRGKYNGFRIYDRDTIVSSQMISYTHQVRCILYKKTRLVIK
jgi:antitoxin component YwqK of YwqJK toxin-antitoxin module